MFSCKGQEIPWGLWTSLIAPSTSVFSEISTFFPSTPLCKGLRAKEPHFRGKGATHFWNHCLLETLQMETHKSRHPESCEDGSGILCSPGYLPPQSCTQPLSLEVSALQGETAGLTSNSLGTSLWETFCCFCFITTAHWGGTDQLSLPVPNLQSQEIPTLKGPHSLILEWTDHVWSHRDRAQNTIYVGFSFPWQVSQSELE